MKQEEDLSTFGSRLRAARKAKKLSQAQLAKMVGISQSMISELENDEYSGSSYTAQLAQAAGVNPLWLAEKRGPRHSSRDATPEDQRGERGELHRMLDEILDRAGPDGPARVKAMFGLIALATGTGKSTAFAEAIIARMSPPGLREDNPPPPANVRSPYFPSTRGQLVEPPGKRAPAADTSGPLGRPSGKKTGRRG